MRRTIQALAALALLALLGISAWGALFGAQVALGEVRRMPPVLAAVALMVLVRGPRALPVAAGWAALGAVLSVAGRTGLGHLGENGWIPGEEMAPWEAAAEISWFALLAALAWRGVPARWTGPLVAAVVATTRIGAYGSALVPVFWEDGLGDALRLGASVGAGLTMGMIVVVLSGWGVSVMARIPERWLVPRRMLAALSVVAALPRAPWP